MIPSPCVYYSPFIHPLTGPIHPALTGAVPGRLTTWPVTLGPVARWLSVGQYLLAGYPRGEKSRCPGPTVAPGLAVLCPSMTAALGTHLPLALQPWEAQ